MITMEEKTTIQISIGCPSGCTYEWTQIRTFEALDDELHWLVDDIMNTIQDKIIKWNGDE